MHNAFVGIGSNLWDKKKNCQRALDFLKGLPQTRIIRVSSLYLTQPVGVVEQPWFINLVVKIRTGLNFRELFKWLKEIEYLLGRRPTIPQGPRVIDLDLLLFDDITLNEPHLIIPHPRLHKRRFVLVPLTEIAGRQTHPVFKRSFAYLLSILTSNEWIIRVS